MRVLASWSVLFVLLGLGYPANARNCNAAGERVSFLALGDAGVPASGGAAKTGQDEVGEALALYDRTRPADALVFLGDNFYPDGLTEASIVPRLRNNLVEPYCRFLSTQGPRWGEVAGTCRGAIVRPAVPIIAVLGNHDHREHGSADLERDSIPHFVSNWSMPDGAAQVFELGCGMSVVAYDSTAFRDGASTQSLTDALDRSQGPWRILIGHHPLVSVSYEDAKTRDRREAYRARILEAVAAANGPVQLMLSGHEHYLAAESTGSGSFLNLIAGTGATTRSEPLPEHEVAYRSSHLGFAQVAIERRDGQPVLRAGLWAVGPGSELQRVAQWQIDMDGASVREEGVRLARTPE